MRRKPIISAWIMAFVASAIAVGLGPLLVPTRGQEPVVPGQTDPTSKLPTLSALAESRIKLARKALDNLHDQVTDQANAERTRWLRRIAETRRDLGGARGEVIADLQAYVARMNEEVKQVGVMQKAGLKAEPDMWEARYDLLEAESWLAMALAKTQ